MLIQNFVWKLQKVLDCGYTVSHNTLRLIIKTVAICKGLIVEKEFAMLGLIIFESGSLLSKLNVFCSAESIESKLNWFKQFMGSAYKAFVEKLLILRQQMIFNSWL